MLLFLYNKIENEKGSRKIDKCKDLSQIVIARQLG